MTHVQYDQIILRKWLTIRAPLYKIRKLAHRIQNDIVFRIMSSIGFVQILKNYLEMTFTIGIYG